MPIYTEPEQKIVNRIRKGDVKLCVVGVGTIGLPLATFLASRGFDVTGYDISKERTDSINRNTVKFEYNKILTEVLAKKKLHATSDPEKIKLAEVIFVCVPTPIDKQNKINLSILQNASETIARNMSKGTVVVFESSVSIGSTKKMTRVIESLSGFDLGRDFGVAYCPERYNPTLPIEIFPHVEYSAKHETINKYTVDKVSRVISATDQKSLMIAKKVYTKFITSEIKEVSSIETAEATKLLENIFRDVNIALANEMAKILPKMGIDAYEVIDAAKTKQFAFLPHYPGTGVGGECIPVDTWYLIKQAEEMGIDTKLMRMAREVNDSMPLHVVELLRDAMKKSGREVKGSKITVLGLSYKKNIADWRVSPSNVIIQILKSDGADVIVCDPVLDFTKSPQKTTPLEDAFKDSDAVILATDHDVFKTINMKKIAKEMRTKIIVDGRNFFDSTEANSNGFIFRAVGKPI